MTNHQLEALNTFRRACDNARGALERVECAAYNRYSAANRAALEATGHPDTTAFQTYADACAVGQADYWRAVHAAADQCARAMQT